MNMPKSRDIQAKIPLHWRADPYDNQSGEMETDTHGLLYSEYERTSEIIDFTSYCSHGTIPRGILA